MSETSNTPVPWPAVCRKLTYGPAGYGSATVGADHVWRFFGYDNEYECWYCERCRLIEKRTALA